MTGIVIFIFEALTQNANYSLNFNDDFFEIASCYTAWENLNLNSEKKHKSLFSFVGYYLRSSKCRHLQGYELL